VSNPKSASSTHQLQEVEDAARTVNQKLLVRNASDDEELTTAFGSFVQERVSAVLMTSDPYFDTRRERLIAFAAQNRLPTIYSFANMRFLGG
jgi:putative ABC transport system substrate-binding protein